MALSGTGAVAMWWDIAPAVRAEFEDWHTHEHFPERLAIPGFRRASRWAAADGGEGFFVLYELASYDTLVSAQYLARLNAPTPWSSKMMPHHRNMQRSQCDVRISRGGALSGQVATVRLSPAPGNERDVETALDGIAESLVQRPGIAAAHLLCHRTPPIAPTAEQRIRGGVDAAADWMFLVFGYDLSVLARLETAELSDAALRRAGARPGRAFDLYRLSHASAAADVGPAPVPA